VLHLIFIIFPSLPFSSGRAHYFHGKHDEAVTAFEHLRAFVTKNPTVIDEGNVRWVEDGLYYLPFISFSRNSREEALKSFRSYLALPVHSDPLKRISILRNTVTLLTHYFTLENYPKLELSGVKCVLEASPFLGAF